MLAQRYRLERRLAQGGMAEVWLATDTLLSRQVAIKLLKPALAADPVVAERFRREAIAVARLNHPNIVAVHDAIADGGRQAVVMQLVNGKSLRQLLDEQKRLSPELTIHIGSVRRRRARRRPPGRPGAPRRQARQHPDHPRRARAAHRLRHRQGPRDAAGDDLTSDNVMMGTAKYLSPEQVRGRKLDGRADLYSLGLVLYECLAGRVPFLGETDADTALARLNRDPTDLARLRPTLPYGLAALIHQLLARRPEDRPPTGAVVKAELARVATQVNDPTTTHAGAGRHGADAEPWHAGDAPAAPTGHRRLPARRATRARRPAGPTPSTGSVRTGRPAGAPLRPDRTPPNTARPRQQPNRAFEQRTRGSLILVVRLLVVAFVIGVDPVGDVAQRRQVDDSPTTTAPADQTGDSRRGHARRRRRHRRADAVRPRRRRHRAGHQGRAWPIDGNPATAWTTVCYGDRFLGGKSGLGLVADLGEARNGTITAQIASAPYQVEVLTAADAIPPIARPAAGPR